MFKSYCRRVLLRLKKTSKSDFLFFRRNCSIAIASLDKDISESMVIFRFNKNETEIRFYPAKFNFTQYDVSPMWKKFKKDVYVYQPSFREKLKCKFLFLTTKFPF